MSGLTGKWNMMESRTEPLGLSWENLKQMGLLKTLPASPEGYSSQVAQNAIPNTYENLTSRVNGASPGGWRNSSVWGNEGFGFNQGTVGAVGAGIQGLGSLVQGYAALKGLGLAEDALKHTKKFDNANLAAQRTTINNRIQNQNDFLQAQGMNNLSKYV